MKGLSAEPIWRKMGQSIAWVAWGGGDPGSEGQRKQDLEGEGGTIRDWWG